MELEESISNLEMYGANNSNFDEKLAEAIDVVLQALENSIPKEVIEDIEKDLYEKFIATGSYEKDCGTPYQERLAGGISCINKMWKKIK